MRRLISFAVALLVLGVLTPPASHAQQNGFFGPPRIIDLVLPPDLPNQTVTWRGKVQIIDGFFCDELVSDNCFPYLDYIVWDLPGADAFCPDNTGCVPIGGNVYKLCLSIDGGDPIQLQSFNVPISFSPNGNTQYNSGVGMPNNGDELFTQPLRIDIGINECGVLTVLEGED